MAFLGPSLRRKRVYDRPGVRVAIATVASILLNALVIWLLVSVGAFELPKPGAAPKPIALAPLTSDQWDANRAIVGGAPPAVAPPRPALPLMPKPPPPPEDERGEFVDVAPGKDQRKPKDSRFLAEHDSTTEKETVSRAAGRRHDENPLQAPSDGAKRPPKELLGEGGSAAVAVPGKEGEKAQRGTGADKLVMPSQKPQEQLAMAPDAARPGRPGEIPVPPRGDRQEIAGQGEQMQLPGKSGDADGGQKRAGKIDPRLLPDLGNMSRIAGGPGLVRPDGVEEGDITSLNTRSFKYATFFQRLYRAITQEWDPNRAYSLRDPEGKMFNRQDRVTGVLIVLSADGAVSEVRVFERSGLDFLDEEAVRAVRAAGPFPNPPTGLAESDGHVRIPFIFTLYTDTASAHVVLPRGLASPSQRPYPE